MDRATSSLGSSWLDSGINALSIIEWFVNVQTMVEFRVLDSGWSTYQAVLSCVAGGRKIPATIITTWGVTDGTRETRLRYSNGVDVVLDHTAVAARILQTGKVLDLFGTDGSVPRRDTHYRNLYATICSGQHGDRAARIGVSRRLHRLLLER